MPDTPVTAVVLCGGTGRRFGGDKTRADLGGATVLDRLLDGLPGGWPVLCVGERRPTTREVTWLREDPPGGGPVAALAAALPHVTTPVLVALGGDMPYAAPAAPALAGRLGAAGRQGAGERATGERGAGRDGDREHGAGGPGAGCPPEVVAARDAGGRVQPLLAAYLVDALRAAVPTPAAGAPLMRLLDRLRVEAVEVADPAALDIDTPGDLERARHRLEP
ncbi:molybdenum cofactor guanylyltransferase [Pedococcus sp. NPDC057267]|uniref:molybdenum cofactor guanylyltransferase n=1 Tax=Pedococcus sp. NPDC057267 TaxID=3346077 RepID=UPI003638A7F1